MVVNKQRYIFKIKLYIDSCTLPITQHYSISFHKPTLHMNNTYITYNTYIYYSSLQIYYFKKLEESSNINIEK